MRNRSKRRMIMYGLIAALVLTTVGYALLQTTLNIGGTVSKKGNSWDIRFMNVVEANPKGSATLEVDPLPEDGASLTFSAKLVKPGDKVSFMVDVVNRGTVDALLTNVELTGVDDARDKNLIYTVEYTDGSPIVKDEVLQGGVSRNITVQVEYDSSLTSLPEGSEETVELTFGLRLDYVQYVAEDGVNGEEIFTPGLTLANAPDLLNGSLTPVMYNGTNWVVADTTEDIWYNYSKQEWANAVVLKSGVTKSINQTIDVANDIQAMYVWIPRYEYKVGTEKTFSGVVGVGNNFVTPQPTYGDMKHAEIAVRFIGAAKSTATEGYTIHPAFQFGDKALSGIWVGKFTTTGTSEAPTILPNQSMLTNQTISEQFNTSKVFGTYLTNSTGIDSHMMKNSEYGAVAYLGQSRYGKYGNNMYSETNKELFVNRSINVFEENKTGYSGGKPVVSNLNGSTSDTANAYYSSCQYNDVTDRGNGEGSCGGGASTTGNIYGVYDMSLDMGLVYVMAVHNKTVGDSGFEESFFTDTNNDKYYDNYTSDDATMATACNGGVCLGHALSETAGWYSSQQMILFEHIPEEGMGGAYFVRSLMGTYSTVSLNGGLFPMPVTYFRSVLTQG